MFTDFINRILGAEPRLSVSNRLEDAVPDGRFPLRCRPNVTIALNRYHA